VRLFVKRLIDFIGGAAGMFFFVLLALIIFSSGRLIGGPTWHHVIGVDGAVWITSVVLLTIMDIEHAFASRRAAEISRWGEPMPWHDRRRRARIAAGITTLCFVVALILGLSAIHRFQLEIWLLLGSGVVLLAYTSILRTEPSASDGPDSPQT
jgi:hypothetical protein